MVLNVVRYVLLTIAVLMVRGTVLILQVDVSTAPQPVPHLQL